MHRLYPVLYWLFFAVSAPLIFIPAALVFLVTWPFDRRRVIFHLICCLWGSFYVYANPLWRVRIIGRARLPWRGPAVIVANHSSIIDILVLYNLYRPFKWVSKRSNFNLPVVGWVLWMEGSVPLVRGDPASIHRMMELCADHLHRGSPVLLFPEGTRSRDGHLQQFRDGAFRLAHQERCPVIPIAIHGTANVLPKNGFIFRNRMDAQVEVLDAIDPKQYDSVDALRDAAQAAIAAALTRGEEGRASAL